MPLELVVSDGSLHPEPGKMVFVDRAVDSRTGTVMAEAAFPNPDDIIRPGGYARVRAMIDLRKDAILVPQRSVRELQGVFSVMVLGANEEVEERLVTPGERLDTLWVILSGLKAGERVVVEGLQKVRSGTKVKAQTILIEDPDPEPDGEAGSPAHEPGDDAGESADSAQR